MTSPPPTLTVIVPTRDEAANVNPLVRRLEAALRGVEARILFIDDSSDGTSAEVRRITELVEMPVSVLHRPAPDGGLSGAVVAGMRLAESRLCVVMDGDLQHPPEIVPRLLERFLGGDVDAVVASRYAPHSSSAGLAGRTRSFVSMATTRITRALFPIRLRGCSDPMTGFFLVDLASIDLDRLRPRGFKILLEILARNELRVAEIPFAFAKRESGGSKASARQAAQLLAQLLALRFELRRRHR